MLTAAHGTNRVFCCSLLRLQCRLNLWQSSPSLAGPGGAGQKQHITTEVVSSSSSNGNCSWSRGGCRYSKQIDESTPLGTSVRNSYGTGSHKHLYTLRGERVNWKGLLPFDCNRMRFLSFYQKSNHRRSSRQKSANKNTAMYAVAIAVAVTGLSYAAVPLYRIFCQASGYGGTVVKAGASEKVEGMEPIRERELTIRFNADTSSALLWQFKPHQLEIKVVPGETALAFYSARNPTDKPVIGIATYNVIPFEAGLYFNKIQCFCFEEQRLNPNEQVDMPVFFYIDPEFDDDPAMAKVDTITLSYTFFESKEGIELPQPLTAS